MCDTKERSPLHSSFPIENDRDGGAILQRATFNPDVFRISSGTPLPLPHLLDSPRHRIRVLVCTAGVLLLLVALVRMWPTLPERTPRHVETPRAQDVIALEEIVATTQQGTPPPPPPLPTLPPVVVENDVELEETPLVLDVPLPSLPGPPAEQPVGTPTGTGEAPATASRGGITRAPQPVRTVQPEYTREARRRRIRAEVVVEVTVGTGGRVERAEIVERYELGRNEERTPVPALGFGLEEAALTAAQRWFFRPALQDGEPVQQTYRITLGFGSGV